MSKKIIIDQLNIFKEQFPYMGELHHGFRDSTSYESPTNLSLTIALLDVLDLMEQMITFSKLREATNLILSKVIDIVLINGTRLPFINVKISNGFIIDTEYRATYGFYYDLEHKLMVEHKLKTFLEK